MARISKIVIDVDEKKIELTPEQAKKLKGALEELYGVKEIVKEEHHHHHNRWNYPYWGWNQPVYCSTAGATMTLTDNCTATLAV